MFAVLSTFSLLSLLACAGLVAPILFSLLERAHQRTQYLEHQLHDQEEVLRERDATIGAYREAMVSQMSTLEYLHVPLRDARDAYLLLIPVTLTAT